MATKASQIANIHACNQTDPWNQIYILVQSEGNIQDCKAIHH